MVVAKFLGQSIGIETNTFQIKFDSSTKTGGAKVLGDLWASEFAWRKLQKIVDMNAENSKTITDREFGILDLDSVALYAAQVYPFRHIVYFLLSYQIFS